MTIFSGPLDGFIDYRLCQLGYGTLDSEKFSAQGDYQGCAMTNCGDRYMPCTHITEHKHFAPWESQAETV